MSDIDANANASGPSVCRPLYKYLSASSALAVLETGSLHYSAPECFNDPFDCQFDLGISFDTETVISRYRNRIWGQYLGITIGENWRGPTAGLVERLRSSSPRMTRPEFDAHPVITKLDLRPVLRKLIEEHEPKFRQQAREGLGHFKVLCLSEVCDSLLMWSHYADLHQGVVLEFRPRAGALANATPVRYSRRMPLLLDQERVVGLMAGEYDLASDDIVSENFRCLLLTKSDCWSYEMEWRVVVHDLDLDAVNRRVLDVEFHPDELSAIYFGCRASGETKSQIADHVRKHYQNALMFAAQKSQRDFALEFEPVA